MRYVQLIAHCPARPPAHPPRGRAPVAEYYASTGLKEAGDWKTKAAPNALAAVSSAKDLGLDSPAARASPESSPPSATEPEARSASSATDGGDLARLDEGVESELVQTAEWCEGLRRDLPRALASSCSALRGRRAGLRSIFAQVQQPQALVGADVCRQACVHQVTAAVSSSGPIAPCTTGEG